jgi:signal transduction histidine kinase
MIPELIDKNIRQGEHFVYFKIEKYVILAILESGEKVVIEQERLYIIRLFLEQAAQAITNVELHESLLRQEKLSAIGQAVSMIVHDLRGPIGSICQGVELVEDMADHREFVKDMHRLIMNEARKSLNMVNDILDFIRNSPLIKSPVDVKPFIESVGKDADELLKDTGINLCVELSKPFYFPADQSKIYRILMNLIKNAAEALKQHNVIQPNIKLSAETASDGFYFRVEDNGPGIPDQIRQNLFVPFVTHNKKEGTGLGLAIVKQFVEAHGGKISVETSPKGTKFSIFLPDE